MVKRASAGSGDADLLNLTPWREKYDWPRWQDALRSSIGEKRLGSAYRTPAVAADRSVTQSSLTI